MVHSVLTNVTASGGPRIFLEKMHTIGRADTAPEIMGDLIGNASASQLVNATSIPAKIAAAHTGKTVDSMFITL